MRLSKEEIEKDSEILGAIIVGAQTKPLQSGSFGVEQDSVVCAIGAGNIAAGVNKPTDIINTLRGLDRKTINHIRSSNRSAAIRFIKANSVTLNYVGGINDGFEGKVGVCRKAFRAPGINLKSKDYARGYAVGAAARVYSVSK